MTKYIAQAINKEGKIIKTISFEHDDAPGVNHDVSWGETLADADGNMLYDKVLVYRDDEPEDGSR